MTLQTYDFDQSFVYENGFYLTSSAYRLGRALAHYELYKSVSHLEGAILECGVFRGVSLMRFISFAQLIPGGDPAPVQPHLVRPVTPAAVAPKPEPAVAPVAVPKPADEPEPFRFDFNFSSRKPGDASTASPAMPAPAKPAPVVAPVAAEPPPVFDHDSIAAGQVAMP